MAYVAVVKALYDYAAQDPETELSLKEDDIAYVIEKEDEEYVCCVPYEYLLPLELTGQLVEGKAEGLGRCRGRRGTGAGHLCRRGKRF